MILGAYLVGNDYPRTCYVRKVSCELTVQEAGSCPSASSMPKNGYQTARGGPPWRVLEGDEHLYVRQNHGGIPWFTLPAANTC